MNARDVSDYLTTAARLINDGLYDAALETVLDLQIEVMRQARHEELQAEGEAFLAAAVDAAAADVERGA